MQTLEIEYKNLLTRKEFKRLLSEIPFPKYGVKQINHYFETKDFKLRDQKTALRIREKNNEYTLTIKQPHPKGILETNASLTKDETKQWLQGKPVFKPVIQKQLHPLGIEAKDLIYFGHLTTIRRSIWLDDAELVLDDNYYLKRRDYELELEVSEAHKGKQMFTHLLKKHHIKQRKVRNKIERFFSVLFDEEE